MIKTAEFARSLGRLSAMDPEEIRESLRLRSQNSLYFLSKAVLGHKDLTVHLHKKLAAEIQDPSIRRKVLEWPRGHLKTTLGTITKPIHRWIQPYDPSAGFYGHEENILLVQSSIDLASLNLQQIQHHFESNILFRWLFPELVPEDFSKTIWNTTQMRIGNRNAGGPSLYAFGVGGKMTGLHVRGIIEDDLIDETIAESEIEVSKRINWHQYAFPLLIEPTKDWLYTVGNRWGRRDLNGWIRENEADCKIMHHKAIENGVPVWPERFPLSELEKIRAKLGPFKYACQYMNDPKDNESSAFKLDQLRYYTLDPAGDLILDDGSIVKADECFKYACVDPAASAGSRSDRTGVIVTYVDRLGRIFIMEAAAIRKDPYEAMKEVYEIYKRWKPTQVGMEDVNFSKLLAGTLDRMAKDQGSWLPIRPVTGTRSAGAKETRINQVVGEISAAGRLFIRKEMGDFIEEYSWFPDPTTHDDLLDALSLSDKLWVFRRYEGPSPKDDAEEWAKRTRRAGRSILGY